MSNDKIGSTSPVGWKKKLLHEFNEFVVNFIYLAIFFGLFTTYRRLILRHYSISYLHYGFALIQALIMAKVILLIDALHWGRKFEWRPLIYSTLWKALMFMIGILVFSVLEHAIDPLVTGKGLPGILTEFSAIDPYELAAHCLVIFFALIPFFAFKEIARAEGGEAVKRRFFSEGSAGTRPASL